ncbi:DUF2184 domain-containing protein [Megamonas hypermegale]|uniref:DUF2184 domain-containing protein n=1 Tax=Megamonas hypermegale TaxID=158847 RepID=UPI0026EB125B|nr:DUF2184 domain-containing protein [Megamonas hypermegale]
MAMTPSIINPTGSLKNAGNIAMKQGGGLYGGAYDAATASGMAYLVGELEKVDPKIREPLTAVTWPRDIVSETGGGWVEYTSTFDVNYGISDPNGGGIQGGSATAIPAVQVDIGKNQYPVHTWMNVLKVPFVDQNKLQQIGRNLEDLLDRGLRLNYQKSLDQNVYIGFTEYGTTGIINDPNVVTALVAAGAKSTTEWNTKTPDEILKDINDAITEAWVASEYDMRGLPNHILIPPKQYAYLVSQKVSEAGNISVLEFLLNNNIGKNQGVTVNIYPCRWCIGTGQSNKDRMMVYVNDKDMLYFDMPVPLTRALTQPSVMDAAYLTLYASQFGVPKFLFYQPVRYYDGI